MANFPEIGKISREVFNEFIYPHLGAKSADVIVGPQHGVDVGIVEIGDKAVALTTDPIFIVPEYGFDKAAWFATHIIISDVVTSGLPPRYMTVDFNFPLSLTEEQFRTIWAVMTGELSKMGVSVIAGHTARYDNCDYPMVGGSTVIAIGELDQYVTPAFIKPGDKLVITKGPAIEATGIFGAMFPELIRERLGREIAEEAERIFFQMSVYRDAMVACEIGIRDEGVVAMHDATECGIYGGVFELAEAANLGMVLNKDAIGIAKAVREICDYFEIDPFKSISEGTLLIAVKKEKADLLIEHLESNGIRAYIAGEFTEREEGYTLIEHGKAQELLHPKVDPFWQAFYKALQE